MSPEERKSILTQLAGEASMCWVTPPTGEFDSVAAMVAVNRAIARLNGLDMREAEQHRATLAAENLRLQNFGGG